MKLSLKTIVKQNPLIPTVELDGEMGLMNPEKGNYYATNGIGGEIWKKIEKPTTINALVDDFLTEYEISRELCEREVTSYLENMLEEGLILIDKE